MADALQEETAEVLARLVRFRTVNPPGDERECQEWLPAYLRGPRLGGAVIGTPPGRAEPGRAARRRAARTHAGLPLARRHRARRPRRLDPRPVERRRRGRVPVGP